MPSWTGDPSVEDGKAVADTADCRKMRFRQCHGILTFLQETYGQPSLRLLQKIFRITGHFRQSRTEYPLLVESAVENAVHGIGVTDDIGSVGAAFPGKRDTRKLPAQKLGFERIHPDFLRLLLRNLLRNGIGIIGKRNLRMPDRIAGYGSRSRRRGQYGRAAPNHPESLYRNSPASNFPQCPLPPRQWRHAEIGSIQ